MTRRPFRLRNAVVAVVAAFLVVPSSSAFQAPATIAERVERAGALVRVASRAVRDGDYDRAIQLYESAHSIAPESIDASCGLAWAYIKNRRYVEANQAATAALEISPDHPRALSLSGYALMRSGLLRQAAEVFFRSATTNASESLAIAGLAEILLYTGNLSESLRYAEQAVRLDDNEPDYLFLLGQVAARAERFEEAAQVYELYLRRAPKIDRERRARIKALIDCCRALIGVRLYARSGPDEASIPIEFSANSLPLVSVMINGRGPYRFAIDTGAGFSVITDELASKLKIRPIARGGTSQGVGGGGTFPLVYGLLRSVGLGPIKIENVPTYIRKSHQDSSDPIDGYIGLSILTRFLSSIDYGERKLDMRPLDSPAPELGPTDIAIPYQLTAGSMLSVPTDVQTGGMLNFIVDTGATTTVVSREAYTRYDLDSLHTSGAAARVVGAAGVSEGVPTIVFSRLSVPGEGDSQPLRADAVRALVLDLSAVNETSGFQISGIVGGNVLRNYRLELDTPRGRLILRPNRVARQ